MRARLAELALAAALLAGPLGAVAQPPEPGPAVPPPPPLLSDTEPAPGGVVLAPLPESTHRGIEEIVVVGRQGYGLPDLGSSFKPPPEPPRRIEVTVLPLYDPSQPERTTDLFAYTPENQRIHYVELFRVRFGRRR